MSETTICSFVMRFVYSDSAQPSPEVWHGWIRHVQSDTELRFRDLESALAFIASHRAAAASAAAAQQRDMP